MKKIYTLILSALFVGCSDELDKIGSAAEGAVELTGINATIETSTADTRAENNPVYLPEHISRFRFENGDRMTFTTIKRTEHALNDFNYVGVEFQSNASGAWDRDKNTGYLFGKSPSEHPQRVYWSDALSKHTFIGFSLPKVDGFDWETDDSNYVGSIGDKNKTKVDEPTIDYNPESPETDIIKEKKDDGSTIDKEIKKSSKMRAEDLLLSYATDLVADASVANVKFYHALSSIKVQVSMSAFYGSALDGYTIVKDMKLLNQPTLYKWTVSSAKAGPYSTTHSENNPKDILLWNYYPNGNGSGANKSFTFYGITVPQEAGYTMQDMVLTFTVKYPDPQKTKPEDIKAAMAVGQEWQHWIEKPFKATISNANPVYFHPGQCTVINLRLNHMDEELTVGAEYMDWQFTPQPDEGDLHKNTTFLESTVRANVKTTKDNVTEDDATWLYYVSQNGQPTEELSDIYGHKGKTLLDAFTISTADQLLSFAYEVNEGKNFEGYYVKLDADIFMQPSTSAKSVNWIGIGNDTYTFNGYFIGGDRKISRLIGTPLFNSIGPAATIDNIVLADTINVSGTGALANVNAGKIIGCVVDAEVTSTVNDAGSLVGTNTGTVEACYHIGGMKGTSDVAGLVGANTGSIIGCYNAGTITGSGAKYGIANTTGNGVQLSCFYNKTLAGNQIGGDAETTLNMQRESFIYDLNSDFNSQSKYSFEYNPAMYPTLIPYVEDNSVLKNGFYRVQNVGSSRYVFITDNKGSVDLTGTNHDLDAMSLCSASDAMYSDPGSIIYVKRIQGNKYNLLSQGTSVNDVIKHMATISKRNGYDYFSVGASDGGVGKLIGDNGEGKMVTNASDNNLLWIPKTVNTTDNYFGINASVYVGSEDYYAPFYADFGFKVSEGMEVYYVSNIADNTVTLKRLTGIVPNKTPVIIKCKSANVTDNRLDLKYYVSSVPGNELKGNMFNNPGIEVGGETKHNNQTKTTDNMRVLAVSENGTLVFNKPTVDAENPQYLPANSSYLIVADGTEEELRVIFE